MAQATLQIRWEVYLRHSENRRPSSYYYVRAVDTNTGKTLLTKSTKSTSKRAARVVIAQLSASVNFKRLLAQKTGNVEISQANALAAMPLADFFVLFWNPDKSPYLLAHADSGKPLSTAYVTAQGANVKTHAAKYEDFKSTPLRSASLFQVEAYVRHLRKSGFPGNVANDALDAIRTPLSWAMKRGFVDEPFSFGSIIRPKETNRKRGILTHKELLDLINLDVSETVTPRPRLKKGEKHVTPGPVDLRIKAAVLLGHLCALRAGEVRALKWKMIDFDHKRIHIVENYVDGDGKKAPKRGSEGFVPLPDQLILTLKDLRRLAFKLGYYGQDAYVIFNLKNPQNPIAMETLESGFVRCLEWIGIPDDPLYKKEDRKPKPGSRQDRHIVFHSGRHLAASLLSETIGPDLARKITRHRTLSAFEGYADHQTEEAIESSKEAIDRYCKQ